MAGGGLSDLLGCLVRLALLALVALAGLACPRPLPPPVPPGPDQPDAAVATCADVCRHAFALDCSWYRPTPGGASCTAVCVNIQTSGVVSWDLSCRVQAETCAAIELCER